MISLCSDFTILQSRLNSKIRDSILFEVNAGENVSARIVICSSAAHMTVRTVRIDLSALLLLVRVGTLKMLQYAFT